MYDSSAIYSYSYNYSYILCIIVISIIVFLILTYIVLKLKYGFWFYQPVFHIYDFKYYLFPPGIIRHALPDKNRYTNFIDIETIQGKDVSQLKTTQLTQFIQQNFLKSKSNYFMPKKENIMPYFVGFNHATFFSFYWQDKLLYDAKTNDPIKDKKLIGFMTTRPVKIFIKEKNQPKSVSRKKGTTQKFNALPAYYVDYLCVDKDYRKKGIAPEIIQTHEYVQRYANQNTLVSLFKREGELTGIVPLCVYKTYCFSMVSWMTPYPLNAMYKLVECNPKNFHFLVDFLKEECAQFDICILPEYANLLELIKTGNIFIYFILEEDEIQSVYFFRKTCIYIKPEAEALTCFASLYSSNIDIKIDNSLFIEGFKNALHLIVQKHTSFQYAVIENISHNISLTSNLLKHNRPVIISPTAYFFYNFAYLPFQPEKTLILV